VIHIVEWELILILEVCKYLTGYCISQKQISLKVRRLWGIIGAVLLILPIILCGLRNLSDLDRYMVLCAATIIGIFMIMKVPIKSRLWQCAILFYCISSIDGVNANGFDRLGLFTDSSYEIQTIFNELSTLIVLLVVLIVKNLILKKINDKRENFYSLLALSSFIICGFFQNINASIITHELSDNSSYYIIGMLSFLAVAFLGSQIWVVFDMNARMKELLKEERILHATQKEYYHSLLQREDETRKYRHDMTNHLMVMNALLNDNSYDELREYLGNLREEFGTIQSKRYVTGNEVIDAISNYYLPTVDDWADIKIRGHIPSDIKTDEVSICTIYSNLLKNAVEELQRLKGDGVDDLKLLVDFKAGAEFFSISVKNTMRDNAVFRGLDTPTSKSDSRNHGFGLGNIQRTVEKEHGKIKIEKRDNMFTADVILPKV
jgi:hypothetical protein